MKNCVRSVSIAAITLSLLAGCGGVEIKKTQDNIKKEMVRAETLRQRSLDVQNPYKKPEAFRASNDIYVGAKRISLNKGRGADLPLRFSEKFALTSASQMTLQEISEQIALEKGYPVSISPDAIEAIKNDKMRVNYSGNLSGFLDSVVSRFGLNWKYDKGTIQIARLETRSWIIRTAPGASQQQASVVATAGSSGTSSSGATDTGNSGGSASATSNASTTNSGSGSQSANTSANVSIWEDLKKSIPAILSKSGSFNLSQSTSTLTATDTSQALDKLDEFVKEQNRQMSRQVVVQVKAYSVNLTDEHQKGIDWNLVYNTAKVSASVVNPYTGAGAAGASIVAQLINPKSQFNGSEVILRGLQSQGNVALLTSTEVTTLNNQPVPVQVGDQVGYLQSSSTSSVNDTGSVTATLTPGTLSTGFNMNVLPSLFSNGKMVMQYSISITDLTNLKEITSAGSTIQLPEVSTINFMQRVGLKSGQTLVLSGFERMTNSLSKGGLSYNSPIFGNATAKQSRDIVVIEITPTIIEDES